ncbi:MAG: hypothetical protein IJV14_04475 [Lachnospiraceae bacterium]|nr:hypothetical protein [Lachnospiraceae bacterium]
MEDSLTVAGIVWSVLAIVGRWLLFRKAGKPGWHSIIPILNVYDEFDICWKGSKAFLAALLAAVATGCAAAGQDSPELMGIAAVALLWMIIIHWKQSMKLARAFGKGTLTGFLLVLSDRLGRIILGLGSAEYVGKH